MVDNFSTYAQALADLRSVAAWLSVSNGAFLPLRKSDELRFAEQVG